MSNQEPPHQVLTEVLQANAASVQEDTDRIVRDFLRQWGDDVCAEDLARINANPEKPIVLVVDCVFEKCELIKFILEDKMGLLVCTAHTGRVMLAKIQVLEPYLIVTGLNTLHFYPPSYAWAVVNAERIDGIPMVFATGASEYRYPREIPKGSKVCVLPVPFNVQECIVAVKEMLQP